MKKIFFPIAFCLSNLLGITAYVLPGERYDIQLAYCQVASDRTYTISGGKKLVLTLVNRDGTRNTTCPWNITVDEASVLIIKNKKPGLQIRVENNATDSNSVRCEFNSTKVFYIRADARKSITITFNATGVENFTYEDSPEVTSINNETCGLDAPLPSLKYGETCYLLPAFESSCSVQPLGNLPAEILLRDVAGLKDFVKKIVAVANDSTTRVTPFLRSLNAKLYFLYRVGTDGTCHWNPYANQSELAGIWKFPPIKDNSTADDGNSVVLQQNAKWELVPVSDNEAAKLQSILPVKFGNSTSFGVANCVNHNFTVLKEPEEAKNNSTLIIILSIFGCLFGIAALISVIVAMRYIQNRRNGSNRRADGNHHEMQPITGACNGNAHG